MWCHLLASVDNGTCVVHRYRPRSKAAIHKAEIKISKQGKTWDVNFNFEKEPKSFKNYIYLFTYCACLGECHHTFGRSKSNFRSQFFPSAMQVSGTELISGWRQALSSTMPSWWPWSTYSSYIFLFQNSSIISLLKSMPFQGLGRWLSHQSSCCSCKGPGFGSVGMKHACGAHTCIHTHTTYM